MKKVFDTYNGGKEAAGVPQSLINVIPPHLYFAEAFGGNFTLSRFINTRNKLINDKSKKVFSSYPDSTPCWKFFNLDYKDFLKILTQYQGVFLYLDPPYLDETRKSKKPIYDCEMLTLNEHIDFLETVISFEGSFRIAISHYPHSLYDSILKDWYHLDYANNTRQGSRIERLYTNYDTQNITDLQDFRYLGRDKTDRQRIKRKLERLTAGLQRLPALEQRAIILKLLELNQW